MALHSGFERERRRPNGDYFTILVRRTGIAPLSPNGFYVYRWLRTWVRRLLKRDRSWTVAVIAGRMDMTSNRRPTERSEVAPTFEAARAIAARLAHTD